MQELLEVPLDVPGGPFAIGRGREFFVDGVASGPVHFDLLEQGERHPVVDRTEFGDLVGRPRFLLEELVAGKAENTETAGRRTGPGASAARRTAASARTGRPRSRPAGPCPCRTPVTTVGPAGCSRGCRRCRTLSSSCRPSGLQSSDAAGGRTSSVCRASVARVGGPGAGGRRPYLPPGPDH